MNVITDHSSFHIHRLEHFIKDKIGKIFRGSYLLETTIPTIKEVLDTTYKFQTHLMPILLETTIPTITEVLDTKYKLQMHNANFAG